MGDALYKDAHNRRIRRQMVEAQLSSELEQARLDSGEVVARRTTLGSAPAVANPNPNPDPNPDPNLNPNPDPNPTLPLPLTPPYPYP